ncbi:hypothetical protein [Shewanella surugensis]|uniref:Uncharacterized protein n=1 Tax=Shewanella surugensis TaxID=212020 RepID=A0ABT0L931_9GAMM|nr:hypothetical protein [Shewanella surugensis]MCL1124059.1 hypothetical protein [Shewanella surugensis]
MFKDWVRPYSLECYDPLFAMVRNVADPVMTSLIIQDKLAMSSIYLTYLEYYRQYEFNVLS